MNFLAVLSFAVNFHFSRAQLMLRGHLPLLSGCLITLPFKWWEKKGSWGEKKREGKKERKKEGERTMGEGVKKEERQRARRRRDTDRACYFQKPFFASIVCRETGISEKKGKKREEVHTDFKKSHFLSDRCGVSFAV